MTNIRFRNFHPRNEDLKPLEVPGVSTSHIMRAIEKELNQSIQEAKPVTVSKTPIRPNWDLKRDFAARNKKLDHATLRAIAQLSGKGGDVSMDGQDEEEQEERYLRSPRRTASFAHQELSDDDDDYTADARRMMSGISKHDIGRDEND